MRLRRRTHSSRSALGGAIAHAEAFRVCRTNLEVALEGVPHPTVLVTSALPGEGKTSTVVDLARAMAASGMRTILVDLDLRHPDVHKRLEAPNTSGVTDVLRGLKPLQECIQFVSIGGEGGTEGLYLLPTGPTVSNPAELLGSARVGSLLEALAEQADIVLIDTPPVLPVADTLVIGRLVDGAVLVVETRRTSINVVRQTKESLERNNTTLLGLVVNKLQAKDAAPGYGYEYGYGYGQVDTPLPEVEASAYDPGALHEGNGDGPARSNGGDGQQHHPTSTSGSRT